MLIRDIRALAAQLLIARAAPHSAYICISDFRSESVSIINERCFLNLKVLYDNLCMILKYPFMFFTECQKVPHSTYSFQLTKCRGRVQSKEQMQEKKKSCFFPKSIVIILQESLLEVMLSLKPSSGEFGPVDKSLHYIFIKLWCGFEMPGIKGDKTRPRRSLAYYTTAQITWEHSRDST